MQFSFDGLEKEHDDIRGAGTFKKAFENLSLLCLKDADNTVIKTVCTTLIRNKNCNLDFEKYINFFNHLNVTFIFQSVMVYKGILTSDRSVPLETFERIKNELVFLAKKYGKKIIRKKAGYYGLSDTHKKNVFCDAINYKFNVYPDGSISPCQFINAGNIMRDSVSLILNNKKMRLFRKRIRRMHFLNECVDKNCCRLVQDLILK